jgi:HSP20 family protein
MKKRKNLFLLLGVLVSLLVAVSLQGEIKDVLGDKNQEENGPKDYWRLPFGSLKMPVDPFFDSFEKEMDEMFKSFKGLRGMQMPEVTRNIHGFAQGRSDVRVEGDEIIVLVDLPGHDKEAIDLRIKNNQLVITSERRSEQSESEEDRFYRREISYGNFSRVIGLPHKVIESKASAQLKDGVLKVTLPIDKSVKADERGYKIEIE